MTFLKISTQVTSNIRAVASVNYQDQYQPVYESLLSLNTPEETSWILDHDSLFAASGIINYRMDQNTFVDLSVGLAQRSKPLLLNVKRTKPALLHGRGIGPRLGERSLQREVDGTAVQGGGLHHPRPARNHGDRPRTQGRSGI